MIPHPLNETSWLSTIEPQKYAVLPAFYKTQFTLPDNPLDTYLDVSAWKKVGLIINIWSILIFHNTYCIIFLFFVI